MGAASPFVASVFARPHPATARLPFALAWTCRRLHIALSRFVLIARVRRQEVCLFELPWRGRTVQSAQVRGRFRASTSRFGISQISGSNGTPLGLHRVAEKVGLGFPIGTVFQSREPVGYTWQGFPEAPIAHRILWLEGLEPGYNRGGSVDSHARYIYIHGLAYEPSLGRPASRGCIHLAAADLMPLCDRIPSGTLVWITE